MGTRHLICVVANDEYKVAQYGQWDGYPSGQGSDILTFLRSKLDRELFLSKLAQTYEPTGEQLDQWYKDAGHQRTDGWMDMGVAQRFKERHPSLSRDAGSDILELIQKSEGPLPLRLNKSFAADSLFCEWAYVIDFDKGTFEVFKGFNKTPLAENERFYGWKSDEASEGYYPVKLKHSFKLDALPSDEEFISILEPQESDE